MSSKSSISFALLLLGACATQPIRRSSEGSSSGSTSAEMKPVDLPPGPLKDSDADRSAVTYRSVQDDAGTAASFLAARERVQAGQMREAAPALEGYLTRSPNGQYADEAEYYLGRFALSNNDAAAALRRFVRIIRMSPPSKLRGSSLHFAAVASSQLGQRRESLAYLAQVVPAEIPTNQRYALFSFWGGLALQEGRALESTLAYLKANRETSDTDAKRRIGEVVGEQISSRLSESELEFLLKEYPSEPPASDIELRLASLKLAAGDRARAQALLSSVVRRELPGSPLHSKATMLLGRLASAQSVSTGRIGVLVPLSGEQETLGRLIADGLKTGIAKGGDGEGKGIELVLADAGPSVETARAAFDRLVLEDRVMAVIGPIGGAQAEAVALKSVELGVPNISLSVRTGLPEIGAYVFRVALTPAKQVQALVGYAAEKLNAKRFAILFPRDGFGREFATEYFKTVRQWGGEVTAAESYEPDQSDFRLPIENMTGKAFPGFRKTEAEDLVRIGEEKFGRKLSKKELEAAEPAPIVDFDVLLIPDTFRAVGQIVPALMYADVTAPRILGPSTWNNSRLLQRAGPYLEDALFVDQFASSRPNASTKEFIDRFQVTSGNSPSPLAAIGYDVGLALRKVFEDGSPSSRDEFLARLENLGTVEGAAGRYVWDSQREPLHEVQLFMIRRGAFAYQGGIQIKTDR